MSRSSRDTLIAEIVATIAQMDRAHLEDALAAVKEVKKFGPRNRVQVIPTIPYPEMGRA